MSQIDIFWLSKYAVPSIDNVLQCNGKFDILNNREYRLWSIFFQHVVNI